jgi:hypothetical protein
LKIENVMKNTVRVISVFPKVRILKIPLSNDTVKLSVGDHRPGGKGEIEPIGLDSVI